MHERINVDAGFMNCLKSYGADIIIIVECESDYLQILLIYLKDRKILHFFTMTKRRGLESKIKRYRNREHAIKLEYYRALDFMIFLVLLKPFLLHTISSAMFV